VLRELGLAAIHPRLRDGIYDHDLGRMLVLSFAGAQFELVLLAVAKAGKGVHAPERVFLM